MKLRIHHIIAAIFVLLVGCSAWAGTVIYVDDDAPLGGDGRSWGTAYRFLQDGLAVAQEGDEIRVAQGVYMPDCNEVYPEGSGGPGQVWGEGFLPPGVS